MFALTRRSLSTPRLEAFAPPALNALFLGAASLHAVPARPLSLAPLPLTPTTPTTSCRRYSASSPASPSSDDRPASESGFPEGFSRFDLQHQQCTGCGATFQFDKPHIAGYLTPARLHDYKAKVQAHAQGQAAAPPISDAELQARVSAQVIDWKYISASQRKKHLRRARHQLEPNVVTQLVCQRCHDIHHTNHSTAAGPPTVRPEDLDLRKAHRSLFVHVVDILDFPLSHFDTSRILPRHAPYLLVFNKADLLPQSATPDRLHQWASHFARRLKLRPPPAGVHVISSKSGAGVANLMSQVESLRSRYALRDVYLLGATNVGKSELINCLHRMVRFPKSAGQLTASRVHGTTVANLPVPLARFAGLLHAGAPSGLAEAQTGVKGHLIDTPGVTLPHRLTSLLTNPCDHKLVHMGKRLVPVTYRVPVGKSIFFGGLARIDYVSGSSASRLGVTVWTSNVLPVHITSVEKADRFCGLEQVEYSEEDDDVMDPSALMHVEERKAPVDTVEAEVEDELELAPALQLDLRAPVSTPAHARPETSADLQDSGTSVATVAESRSEPKPAEEQGPCMNPDLLPKILVPPTVDSRATLPQWQLAGSWAVSGHGIQRSWADIVVGSVGWICISGEFDRARFRVFTPGGKGAVVRDSLMPHDFGYPIKKVD